MKGRSIETYRIISKLSKRDILRLSKQTCKAHSHSMLAHPNCAIREGILITSKDGKSIVLEEKIGFLDIETFSFNFAADTGIVLTYVIKELDGKIIKNSITSKECLLKENNDKRLMKDLIKDMKSYTRVIGHYSCLTPGHRILTTNLKWIPVENLKSGDTLLGFEAEKIGNGFRKFKESTVLHNEPVLEEVYNLKLSDGTELQSTGNHPWLVKSTHAHRWATTEQLYKTFPSKIHNGGINFNRILNIWHEEKSYEAGWLSGFFDGEGSVSQPITINNRWGKYGFTIYATQHEGKTVDRTCDFLKKFNFEFSVRVYDKEHPYMRAITILGGLPEKLRFLGQIRPNRLLENFNIDKLGALKTNMAIGLKIIEIKPIGKKIVMGLGTTTETYISEGFASHNTFFDLPFLRSRAVYYNLPFPIYQEIYHSDTFFMLKSKFSLKSKSLRNACKFFGIPCKQHGFDWNNWYNAAKGDKKALSHVLAHNTEDVISTELLWKKINMFTLTNKRSI